MEEAYAAILAAGLGTRMRSDRPKVLHELGGRPMTLRALEAVKPLATGGVVLVIGHGGAEVRDIVGPEVIYAVQERQLGTGDALAVAVAALAAREGDLLVTYGDMPLLRQSTLADLLARHRRTGAAATMLTASLGPESRFGRIVRDGDGRFLRIVEYRDAAPAERAISEMNVGVYIFRLGPLRRALPGLGHANAQGEYYLTDLFPLLMAAGNRVEAVEAGDPAEFYGPNDRLELAAAEAELRAAINRRWMEEGVTMVDPATTYIEDTVRIGRDTVLLPCTILAGRTEIGPGCRLGPCIEIRDSILGAGVRASHAVVEGRRLEAGERVGPFAHLV